MTNADAALRVGATSDGANSSAGASSNDANSLARAMM
jgi:hypothetical protein